uniref:Protein tyrosine phosphatase receptor type K n=1 Tax=Homo sapiens TaxID=9606 RepID=E9PMV4_HUMAN
MDTTAAAALPAFVALLLLSPWPLLGSAQGQFSAEKACSY